MWLALAREWGLPPWRIEEEAPALWVDRWLAVEEARGKARPDEAGPGAVSQQGNAQKRRLI